jgi:sodium/potassium-transporting ATPase subunit alpha
MKADVAAAAAAEVPTMMMDLEKGKLPQDEVQSNKTIDDAPLDDAPFEPYLELRQIAELHPESRVDLANIEKSAGLSSNEAARRLITYGKNSLTPPPKTPEWRLLLKQFQNTFLLLLNASAVLSLVAYFLTKDVTNLYLAIVLAVVVFMTGYAQYHEESKAYKIMDSFSRMLATTCTVIRDQKQQKVQVEQLVPGDLVLVNNGDKVPADMVLLLCRGLKTENSSLTGESEPIACTDRVSSVGTRMFECKNMAFNSSLCFDGTAIGLVMRTGDKTAIGTIAKLASDTEQRESTLQKEVRNFVKLIAIVAVTMAALCFVISVYLQKAKTANDIIKLFVNGFLIIIVANVPQGLPSTVISLLSLAARNMALRSVLVKRLDCVETLGSTSIICSDKTGTLTKNEMTVTGIWCNQRLVKRHRREAKSMFGQDPQALLYRASILCNRGQPISDSDQVVESETIRESQRKRISNVSRLSWRGSVQKSALSVDVQVPTFSGNPSDIALLTYCDQLYSVTSLRKDYPILFEVPFNSTNKWQLVVVKSVGGKEEKEDEEKVEYEVLMKGAPEVILGKCRTYASRNDLSGNVEITEAFRQEFTETYENFASQGRRVLALCSRTFQASKDFDCSAGDGNNTFNFPTTDLNFIGLVAIMDPPRDNVPEAIAKCHRAGVKVFMVTGDHPFTAKAIAKQVGLLKGDNNIELLEDERTPESDWNSCEGAIVHGSSIDGLTDEQWHAILSKPGVCFARTTPAHKLLIVKKCQTLMGAIVAVTGDGVNDAPALKQADVGVAMGLNGSAVAQDSADILLMDDNFASIVYAIEEGRMIFANIKKTIAYTMAHIFPEVFSAILSLLGGLPAGLTALQVLTIDLGTEMGPAISLAYEKAEGDLMDRKPRDPLKDRLVSPVLLLYSYVTSGAVITIGCLLAYMFTYSQNDLLLSDFHSPGLDASGGDFFSLTASEPVEVQRTGRTYSADEQRQIFSEAATAFYITLTMAQFCHIWVCKTRTSSLFKHGFGNKLTFYGVAFGLSLVILFSYVPGVQSFVGSANVGWIPWVCGIAAGSVLWVYNEGSKWYFRHATPGDVLVRIFAW